MKNILDFPSIQQFVKTLGNDVLKYFGKEPACIICLRPDGVFYGAGLHVWLLKKKKDINLISMDDDARDLQAEKVRRRKVLIVDNDVVTGKGYKRSMEALRMEQERLGLLGIKFATFFDRIGATDFSVERYSPEIIWQLDQIDAVDLNIIKYLSQDGRTSFADIEKGVKLSSVAVKNRVDRLLRGGILRVRGELNINRFYTISAGIQIEATPKTAQSLIEKFQKRPEVYHIAKRLGRYNLTIGILAQDIEGIEDFVDKEIRMLQGVRQAEIVVGELPVIPKTFTP